MHSKGTDENWFSAENTNLLESESSHEIYFSLPISRISLIPHISPWPLSAMLWKDKCTFAVLFDSPDRTNSPAILHPLAFLMKEH